MATITCLIYAHGEETNTIIPHNIDKNIRILSKAGVPGCLGTANNREVDNIINTYLGLGSEITSFEKLEYLQKSFLDEDQSLIMMYNLLDSNDKKSKFSFNTVNKRHHSKIYKPIFDHIYYFQDIDDDPGIFILETSEDSVFEMDIGRNLLSHISLLHEYRNIENEKYEMFNILFESIDFPDFTIKPNNTDYLLFHEMIPIVSKKFVNKPISNILKISLLSAKINKRHNYVKQFLPFFQESKDTSEVFTVLQRIHNGEIKMEELPDYDIFISKLNENWETLYERLYKEIYERKNKIKNINLSTIIEYLKSNGYSTINIIDLSCRTFSDEMYEKEGFLNERRELESMGVEDPKDLFDRKKMAN